jgi:hypothetical protein
MPSSFGSAVPTAADSFAIAYPRPLKRIVEIRTLPEAMRAAIRVFAPIMLGLGILGAFSGGFCLISSILVLVQGALWLNASSSVPSLAIAVNEMATTPGIACCGGTFTKLRGLAISGIVFACIELLLALGIGIGIGYAYVVNGAIYSCYCPAYYSCTCSNNGVINYYTGVGIWLFYAAGNSIIAAALNISLSVATLHLLQIFAAVESSPSPAQMHPVAVASRTMGWAAASSGAGAVSDWSASAAAKTEGPQVSVNPIAMGPEALAEATAYQGAVYQASGAV